jgi:hypothetical protein
MQGKGDEVIALVGPLLDRARCASDETGVAASQVNLASCLLQLHRFVEAEAAARECMRIRGRIIPEGDPGRWRYFYAMSLLGGALTGLASDPAVDLPSRLERLREAEHLVVQGYSALKDANVPAPVTLIPRRDLKHDALQRVIDLYEAWNTAEPGAGYDAKAAHWRAEAAAKSDLTEPAAR